MEKNQEGAYRISLDVTHCCNLKCKLCAAHVSSFEKPWHPTLDFLKKTVDKLFEIVPRMDRLVIAGGEPLLRNDLADFFAYLYRYADRVDSRVEIITNGSILPSQELLHICEKFAKENKNGQGMYFIVDNYGPELSPHLSQIGDMLSERNIPHELRDYYVNLHCDGWVDFGEFKVERSEKEGLETFNKCAFPKRLNFCFKVMNGRIDPCAQSLHCMRLGLFDEPEEYIEMFDETTSLEQKRQKMMSWYHMTSLHACRYCNGMCEDSKRFQPAEQL